MINYSDIKEAKKNNKSIVVKSMSSSCFKLPEIISLNYREVIDNFKMKWVSGDVCVIGGSGVVDGVNISISDKLNKEFEFYDKKQLP